MKTFFLAALAVAQGKVQSNPIGTAIALLNDLTAKITKEGEVEAKAYAEYVEWCDDVSKNIGFAIKTATKDKAELEAQIIELNSDIEAAGSKIDSLASDVSTAQADLKAAKTIRAKETADFAASEKELVETIHAITRAITILEREMSKNPAAFTQVDNQHAAAALEAFSAILDAASLSSSDQKKLAALVQSQQADDADSEDLGSPSAAAYKTHSGNILDVLEDLKEKAEEQLSTLRKAEVNSKHNFEMLAQSLEDQSAADSKDMGAQKAGRAAAEEAKATAQGDLRMTTNDLANSKDQQATA